MFSSSYLHIFFYVREIIQIGRDVNVKDFEMDEETEKEREGSEKKKNADESIPKNGQGRLII